MKVLPLIQVRETSLKPVSALSRLELREKYPHAFLIKKVGLLWTGVVEVPKTCSR